MKQNTNAYQPIPITIYIYIYIYLKEKVNRTSFDFYKLISLYTRNHPVEKNIVSVLM